MRTPLGQPMMRAMGVAPERTLSPFARAPSSHAGASTHEATDPERARRAGKVVYFHDTFTTYNYPRIGLRGRRLLEAAGFDVIVEERRACCGRPMLSKGLINDARKVARKNVAAAGALRARRHPDRRHRAELHPDPARRVPRPAAGRRRRAKRSPSQLVHDRRVPGQARRRRAISASAGRSEPAAGGALPRPLPPEGADRDGAVDGRC